MRSDVSRDAIDAFKRGHSELLSEDEQFLDRQTKVTRVIE